MNVSQRLLSEALGTFFLCFASIGAILSTAAPISSGVGLLGISMATGLALSVAVGAFGGIGGAHFNPAVTIGFFIAKRIKFVESVLYILVQLLSACVAAWACQVIWPPETVAVTLLGLPFPAAGNIPGVEGSSLTLSGLLLCEFILSFLLMTAIYGTALDHRGKNVTIGGFGIGLTVSFCILVGGPITGSSMNPARSFGSAFVYKMTDASSWGVGDAGFDIFTLHWCYWVAPIAGVAAAALLYENFLLSDEE